jgi:1-propanol dehydrogenase
MEEISFKTKIFIGEDSLDRLREFTNEKILIVTDPFIAQSGLINEVTGRLEGHGNQLLVFSDIVPDPPIEKVAAGVKVIQEFNPGLMIAIGGGSAIDAAKAMKEFSLQLNAQQRVIKFIAIPTTSGTGSEVTSFSVITDNAKHVKYPLVSESLLPDEAILDSSLIKTVPPSVTADTGMDVLTHAIEAYVSSRANDFSDALAEKAVQLVFDYLPRAFHDGNDLEAREKVHYASCLAGMAFNMAGLGINHSIAHVCGAQFHIPHGRMNALLLPAVMEYNAELQGSEPGKTAKKYAMLAKLSGYPAINARVGVRSLIQHIVKLESVLQMPKNLRACGISIEKLTDAMPEIVNAALNDGCTPTNPRNPTAEDITAIVKKIY